MLVFQFYQLNWYRPLFNYLKVHPESWHLSNMTVESKDNMINESTCLHHRFMPLRLFFFMLYCFELISDWRARSFVVSIQPLSLRFGPVGTLWGEPSCQRERCWLFWLHLMDTWVDMNYMGITWAYFVFVSRQWVEIHVEVNEKLQRCLVCQRGSLRNIFTNEVDTTTTKSFVELHRYGINISYDIIWYVYSIYIYTYMQDMY